MKSNINNLLNQLLNNYEIMFVKNKPQIKKKTQIKISSRSAEHQGCAASPS